MLKNNACFDSLQLEVIFGKNNLINFDSLFSANGVSIDTRILEKGNIFVALVGEKIDGHSKIKEAIEKGAVCCIVNKSFFNSNNEINSFPLIIVDDTLDALGELAKFHRLRFSIPIIAILGSNGKTTTKEMVSFILEKKFKVLKTHENFNNRIGVPLMLFQLSDEIEIAVLELGTNTPGEITMLSEICLPNYALITNIGKEHLEELIDIDGVEMEETSVFSVIKGRGTAFINNDDDRLKRYIMILDKYVRYGTNEDSELIGKIELNSKLNPTINFTHSKGTFSAEMQTFGYVSALNAIAATAVGMYFDVDNELIVKSLQDFKPLLGKGYARMFVEEVSGITIINDCYNANPSSMEVALNNLKYIECSAKRICVLGDMLELGDASINEHINILSQANDLAELVIVFGNNFKLAFNHLNNIEKIFHFEDKEKLNEFLLKNVEKGDAILFKGSRGMKIEEIILHLKNRLCDSK